MSGSMNILKQESHSTGAGWLPATIKNLLRWECTLFKTGSVKDKLRTGTWQPRGTWCQEVNSATSKSPKKSTGKLSAELGVPHTIWRRHMKVDIKLFPYRPLFVQELSDDDLNCQCDAGGRMFQEFRTVSKKKNSHFQWWIFQPYTEFLDCGILCFGPRRTHIFLKRWNILLHMSWYRKQWIASTWLDHISLMDRQSSWLFSHARKLIHTTPAKPWD